MTTTTDRSPTVTDPKPAPAERIHIPMQPHQAALHTLDAIYAGMPARSARRWPRYLDMKDRLGERPISLTEAIRQCFTARGYAPEQIPARRIRQIVTASRVIDEFVREGQ